jgi:hypothetical protein
MAARNKTTLTTKITLFFTDICALRPTIKMKNIMHKNADKHFWLPKNPRSGFL